MMLSIRPLSAGDQPRFMEMCRDFYSSPAISHPVGDHVFEATFSASLTASPYLRGLALEDEEGMMGYALLTFTYSGEVGGLTVMVDEIYLDPRARGRGYGTEFFRWMFEEYKATARRFRLEVTDGNPGAIALYERLGFVPLEYRQMVLDVMEEGI